VSPSDSFGVGADLAAGARVSLVPTHAAQQRQDAVVELQDERSVGAALTRRCSQPLLGELCSVNPPTTRTPAPAYRDRFSAKHRVGGATIRRPSAIHVELSPRDDVK